MSTTSFNENGLTFFRWKAAATASEATEVSRLLGIPSANVAHKLLLAWQDGEDPSDWRKKLDDLRFLGNRK